MSASDANPADANQTWLARHRRLFLIGFPVVFLAIAVLYYLTSGRYVSTDNAYVQSARTDISSNIAGRVTQINVHENQFVHRGDVLFTLDNREQTIAVESAQAALLNAKMQISALKATYQQRLADVNAAQNTVSYLKKEFERQQLLASQGISTQIQLDDAKHAFDNAQQQIQVAQQAQVNALAALDGNANISINEHPAVKQAQSTLDKAQLNQTYTEVKAPVDGVVTKVDQLQVGNYITAATPVFALMSHQIWVEANFKETQLTHMHPGQSVNITVDSYPGKTLHGKVLSLSPGTGSSFAVLPPENATGNWVKVVQRLPVRISIDDCPANISLHAGLSAVVEVDTQFTHLQELKHG